MTTVSVIYALLFYVATIVLVVGLGYKITVYARTPQPLKIPTTPAPTTRVGVAWRLFKELVVFESLFKANKWLWFFGWVFHFALLLALFHHLSVFFGFLAWLLWLSAYAGILLVIGLVGLWARRFLVDRIRYISAASDHLMLALLMGIVLSGLGMRYLAYPDIAAVREFFCGLLLFAWKPLPAQPLLLLHLGLVAILMIIFPMSKLLHAPGLFFSPTRNQVDDARERRHVAGWTAHKKP
jgi:[DsrC]-trisulfide reductase subunit M